MNPQPHLYIITPVYNRWLVTNRYLEMVAAQDYKNKTIVIVDDASTDDTQVGLTNWSSKIPELVVIRSIGNAWWGGGINLGLKYVLSRLNDTDCVLFINDDVYFESDLLSKMVEVSEKYPNTIIGAVPVFNGRIFGGGSRNIFWPLALSYKPVHGKRWPQRDPTDTVLIDFQGANCVLYPAIIVKKNGFIKESLPHYHGDGEYSHRAIRNGFESRLALKVPVFLRPEETGLFNNPFGDYKMSDLWRSLFAIKSINHLKSRWEFAKAVVPIPYQIPYFVFKTAWMLVRSIIILESKRWQKVRSNK